MNRSATIEIVFFAVMVVATALFLGRMLAPESGLYGVSPDAVSTGVLSDLVLLRLAATIKLAFLLLGAVVALRVAAHFGAENPVRPAWLHLGLGLAATALGQLGLACYQFSPRGATPFPSLADYFYVLSYPLFIAALISFMQAYEAAGFPLGTRAQRWRWGLIVAGVAAVVGAVVLRPVVLALGTPPSAPPDLPASCLDLILAARADQAAQAAFLNVAYPVLDLILLVPTVLLLKASLPLRGGQVWKAWAALLAGFLFLSAGDVLFAYFSALGITKVDPLVHATYVLAYGFLALGVVRQQRLLVS